MAAEELGVVRDRHGRIPPVAERAGAGVKEVQRTFAGLHDERQLGAGDRALVGLVEVFVQVLYGGEQAAALFRAELA